MALTLFLLRCGKHRHPLAASSTMAGATRSSNRYSPAGDYIYAAYSTLCRAHIAALTILHRGGRKSYRQHAGEYSVFSATLPSQMPCAARCYRICCRGWHANIAWQNSAARCSVLQHSGAYYYATICNAVARVAACRHHNNDLYALLRLPMISACHIATSPRNNLVPP